MCDGLVCIITPVMAIVAAVLQAVLHLGIDHDGNCKTVRRDSVSQPCTIISVAHRTRSRCGTRQTGRKSASALRRDGAFDNRPRLHRRVGSLRREFTNQAVGIGGDRVGRLNHQTFQRPAV
jgi:hypothetical protein